MAYYKYIAKNHFGESVKGKVEAPNARQAAAELSSRKLLVIDVRPLTEDSLSFVHTALFGIKFSDVVNFTRQLSTMISAGLPLATSLSILVQQSKSEMSRLVATILQEIEGGTNFADALAKRPDVFNMIYVQLVRAGEVGGVLDQILDRLAINLEKSKDFKSKTKGAMIYPLIVVVAMIAVAFVMMIFVIPKLTAMYADFGADLPMATQILMGISSFMVTFWWAVLGGIVGGVIFFKRWTATKLGKKAFDKFLLKIPIMGVLIQKIALTEFARTLALLLSAGISLLQAMEIVTKGVENTVYREALEHATKQIEKGVPLSKAIGAHEEFPPILFQMMAVGEETGKLDEVLSKLSQYFEEESSQAVKNLTTAIEPLIMIVLGLGVGAMVIAVIMPIYNLTSQF